MIDGEATISERCGGVQRIVEVETELRLAKFPTATTRHLQLRAIQACPNIKLNRAGLSPFGSPLTCAGRPPPGGCAALRTYKDFLPGVARILAPWIVSIKPDALGPFDTQRELHKYFGSRRYH